jgi:hypothetical protein
MDLEFAELVSIGRRFSPEVTVATHSHSVHDLEKKFKEEIKIIL